MRFLPAIIFHLLPVIPLVFGYFYLAVATALLVGLAYIKVGKLKLMEVEMEKRRDKGKGKGSDKDQAVAKPDPSIRKAIEFWERLTFLKQKD